MKETSRVEPDPSEERGEAHGPMHSLVVPKAGPAPAPPNVAAQLVQQLEQLGVQHAFGIFGGGIGPLCRALADSSIRLMHCRHESGAAFGAIEASLASGRLTVVVVTTGPGLSNSYTGMLAARCEGAKVLFLSGHTSGELRGRYAFQETSSRAPELPGVYSAGAVFHHAAILESPAELRSTALVLARGVQQPGGFVAHLGVPLAVQAAPVAPSGFEGSVELEPAACGPELLDRVVEIVERGRFAIWLGFGARHAAAEVRRLVDLTGARVMASPRAKGTFPESHPAYLGVTGLGGHSRVVDSLVASRPEHVLVLGTRLGEMTSFWLPELSPSEAFVHVDLDPAAFGAAYPSARTMGVCSEIGRFLRALLDRLSARQVKRGAAPPSGGGGGAWPPPSNRPGGANGAARGPSTYELVRPSALMHAVQREVVERTSSIVMTEAGNAFAFGTHWLQFDRPLRYRVSTGFGSMGQAVAGVLGAALASEQRAVAIVGDGAMLMQNEINTAATYGIDVTWIILNDAGYRMIAQGMESVGWRPFETDFVRCDFVQIAEAMGARGVRVRHEGELEEALSWSMQGRGPFVVDVWIDPEEKAPTGQRNRGLTRQGVGKQAG